MLRYGGFLPHVINTDEKDLARGAKFTATSARKGAEPAEVANGISRKLGDAQNGWVSAGVAPGGEVLTMRFDGERTVSAVELTFCSDFRYPIRVTMAPNRQKQQRPGVPAELVKDYEVCFYQGDRLVHTERVSGNYHRRNALTFPPVECDRVEFRFLATNGAPDVTVFEVRAY